MINIEVSYALPYKQQIMALKVEPNTTVYTAAIQSGISNLFPDLDLEQVKMGVFGKVVSKPKEKIVKEGDRVEIYRPLLVDPKEVRKARAAKVKAAKEG